jgi:hypothetical protein
MFSLIRTKEVRFTVSIPTTYQDISNYVLIHRELNLFELRKQTFQEIEKITKNLLICYVTKTSNIAVGTPIPIDDDDIVGFSD